MTNAHYLELFGNMMEVRKLSPLTQKSYWNHFQKFSEFKQGKQLEKLSSSDVRDYLIYLNTKDVSDSYFNQAINGIRFFFTYSLHRKIKDYMVLRPKKAKTKPTLLSDSELQAMFDVCENTKHKAIMSLAFSAGLRVSEIVNLKITDIDSKSMVIHVFGKGRKTRMTVLDSKVLELLRRYYSEYKPKEWLFNGQVFKHEEKCTIKKYSVGSIQQIVKRYARLAQVQKRVWVHLLRHQFCSGVLEQGGDIHDVAELAGHQSLRTSAVYCHLLPKYIAAIKSPVQNIRL